MNLIIIIAMFRLNKLIDNLYICTRGLMYIIRFQPILVRANFINNIYKRIFIKYINIILNSIKEFMA